MIFRKSVFSLPGSIWGRFRTIFGTFLVPKRSEIASGTSPENALFFGPVFGRFLVDFGALFGPSRQVQVNFLGLLFGVFSVALFFWVPGGVPDPILIDF